MVSYNVTDTTGKLIKGGVSVTGEEYMLVPKSLYQPNMMFKLRCYHLDKQY